MKRVSHLLLLVIALISTFLGYQSTRLETAYEVEDFFGKGDAATRFYQQFLDSFEVRKNTFFVGIEGENGVFSAGFLKRISRLADELRELDGIQSLRSPLDLNYFVREPLLGLYTKIPYLDTVQESSLASDSAYIFSSKGPAQSFFSKERKALLIVLEYKNGLSDKEADELLRSVEAALRQHEFSQAKLAGDIVVKSSLTGHIKGEFFWMIGLALALLVCCLWLFFRSIRVILLPLLVVVVSAIWLLGIMSLLGESLGILSNVLPVIILVVGVSDSVHILSAYQVASARSNSGPSSPLEAPREVFAANLLTSLTTGLGFLALGLSDIGPIRQFGAYAALGVMIAFLLSYTLLPAILVLIAPNEKKQGRDKKDLTRFLNPVFEWIMGQRRAILAGSFVVVLLGGVGISRLKTDNKLVEALRKESHMMDDLAFFEEEFGGIRNFDMVICLKESQSDPFSPSMLDKLRGLHVFLENEYGLSATFSPLSLFEELERGGGGKGGGAVLRRFGRRNGLQAVMSEGGRQIRISGRMQDLGSLELRKKNEALAAYMSQHWTENYQLTGIPVLIDRSHQKMSINLVRGLGVSLLFVSFLVGLVFFSWRIIWISLLVNVIPLLVIGAILGWSGIGLKLSTSILFTIIFGIGVDDSLHFLTAYKKALSKGGSRLGALRDAFLSKGRAILFTSVILCGGFLVLTFSIMEGTFFLGLFTSLGLFVAILADLFLLPVLLLRMGEKH